MSERLTVKSCTVAHSKCSSVVAPTNSSHPTHPTAPSACAPKKWRKTKEEEEEQDDDSDDDVDSGEDVVKKLILDDRFWQNIVDALRVMTPIVKLLRLCDGDLPDIGKINDRMFMIGEKILSRC